MREALPALRHDLRIVGRIVRGRPSYLIEHPGSGAIVDLGEEEHFLCRQLDGDTDAATIARRYRERFAAELATRQLEALVRQLAHHDLLEGGAAGLRRRTFAEWLDPEELLVVSYWRWSGADAMIGRLARRCGFLFTRPVVWLGTAAALWAVRIILTRWDPLLAAVGSRWGYGFFLGLILPGCLFVRSARSLVHGLKSKREGGHVPQAGIALLYYILPSFYCDWWSDVVWVPERARRFRMIFGGLYFQLVLWAIGAIGWHLTTPDSTANELWLALTLSSALTLVLLSANPLVMMEGYALLLNWLEIPRLRERSLAVFGALACLLPPPEPLRWRRRLLFALYGGMVFLYALVMVTLHLWLAWVWLTDAFAGVGALLTVGIALYLMQRPILEFLRRRRFVNWLFDRRAGPLQWAARAAIAAGIALCGFIPCDYDAGGPFTLLPERRHEIRTQLDGLIEEVFVGEGTRVTAKQPIARLRQPDPGTGLEMARARLRETEAQIRLLRTGARDEAIELAETAVRKAEGKVGWSGPRATRYTDLYAEKLVTPQEYDNAQWLSVQDTSELSEAKAQLALVKSPGRAEQIQALEARAYRYEAQITDYLEQVRLTTLRSPVDGVVVTPRIEQSAGHFVEAGDLVALVAATGTVRAEIEVPQESIREVRPGSRVRLTAWAAPEERFTGRVAAIAPAASEAGGTTIVRVTAEFPDPGENLRPEMTGYAKITAGTRPLWQVLLEPPIRWASVEAWSWIP